MWPSAVRGRARGPAPSERVRSRAARLRTSAPTTDSRRDSRRSCSIGRLAGGAGPDSVARATRTRCRRHVRRAVGCGAWTGPRSTDVPAVLGHACPARYAAHVTHLTDGEVEHAGRDRLRTQLHRRRAVAEFTEQVPTPADVSKHPASNAHNATCRITRPLEDGFRPSTASLLKRSSKAAAGPGVRAASARRTASRRARSP